LPVQGVDASITAMPTFSARDGTELAYFVQGLLAHSAGANIAMQYAVQHRPQVGKPILITPSGRAAGLAPDGDARRVVVGPRRDEPWCGEAAGAFERIAAGAGFVVQPDAGHYPWLDDAGWFVRAVTAFLDGR
jgi:pimeloyl-ACP methyl ester carboxylesterase